MRIVHPGGFTGRRFTFVAQRVAVFAILCGFSTGGPSFAAVAKGGLLCPCILAVRLARRRFAA